MAYIRKPSALALKVLPRLSKEMPKTAAELAEGILPSPRQDSVFRLLRIWEDRGLVRASGFHPQRWVMTDEGIAHRKAVERD